MLQVHDIKDSIALHGENIRSLSKYGIPPITIVDGCERIQCDECKTTFGKSCPHDYRQHKSLHRILRQKIKLKVSDYHEQLRQRMEAVQEDDFPCLDCPQRFSEYHKYKLHARKQLILHQGWPSHPTMW